jgi:hypothetical protein
MKNAGRRLRVPVNSCTGAKLHGRTRRKVITRLTGMLPSPQLRSLSVTDRSLTVTHGNQTMKRCSPKLLARPSSFALHSSRHIALRRGESRQIAPNDEETHTMPKTQGLSPDRRTGCTGFEKSLMPVRSRRWRARPKTQPPPHYFNIPSLQRCITPSLLSSVPSLSSVASWRGSCSFSA